MDSAPAFSILPLSAPLLALSLAFSILVAGCGEKVAPIAAMHVVKGKVSLPKPVPIAGAKIFFIPDGPGGRTATGEIKADGSFELTTDTPGDGIAEGKYKVRFDQVPGATPKGTSPPIPNQFLDEDGSGLSAVIAATTTEVGPFVLKPTAATDRSRNARD